jgi:hypothetical protein
MVVAVAALAAVVAAVVAPSAAACKPGSAIHQRVSKRSE